MRVKNQRPTSNLLVGLVCAYQAKSCLTANYAHVMLGRMDHDQRFKILIQEFFVEFLYLFFAEWAARLDLSAIEWLDKELFPNPPEGPRHSLDLVAQVRVAASEPPAPFSLLLVHVEIESPDRTTDLKERLPYYYHYLRDKYKEPVLPIVLYLKVGLDGIGTDFCVDEVWELEVSRFQYLYVGLPGLNAIEYLQGDNWLGVALAALMKIPKEQVAWLGAEALRRLAGAPLSTERRFLLAECVQAYLPLEEQQKQAFDQLLQSESYSGVKAMNKTVYEQGIEEGIEQGIEKGIEKGRRAGQLDLICSMIEERFGSVTPEITEHLEQLSMAELRHLALKIGTAESLAELGLPTSQEE